MNLQGPISLSTRDHTSDEFSIIILKTNILSSTEKSYEVFPIPGRNGSLTIDNGSYEDFTLMCECYINQEASQYSIEELAIKIKRWLKRDVDYLPITVSTLSNYYLEGYCNNKLDIEEVVKNLGKFMLTFTCKPFKKKHSEKPIIVTSKETKIMNDGAEASEPYLKVIGSGDINLYIGNQTVVLKAIEGEIIIDSEEMNAYKVNNLNTVINQNDKMYSPFPVLNLGENNISWTGTVTSIEILPRIVEM